MEERIDLCLDVDGGVPRSIDADLMTDDELLAKIREGLEDARVGRARDARSVFAAHRAMRG